MDILTLACLTAVVTAAFRTSDAATLQQVGLRRGEDLIGVARWLLNAGETERSLDLFKRAIDLGLPDKLLFRSLWDVAALEKKMGRPAAALKIYTELAGCRNDQRVAAFEELAKYYEHDEKSYAVALEFTRQALEFERTETLLKRKDRLERRLAKPRARRLI
jgi:tetratricopeptide (TPR) repeat protein